MSDRPTPDLAEMGEVVAIVAQALADRDAEIAMLRAELADVTADRALWRQCAERMAGVPETAE